MRLAAPSVLLVTLAACAATIDGPTASPNPTAEPIISISRGPCFGFCPVYTVSVARGGRVSFQGERHTALLGNHARAAPAGAYGRLSRAFARYRPAAGETRTAPCERRLTDQSIYTIIWRSAGVEPATLTFDMGCGSGPTDALRASLETSPITLGVADWAAQTTRPDATRG